MSTLVKVNEKNQRIGDDHPRAKLMDVEVEMIRELHEEGMSYTLLAKKFEVSPYHIGRICRFQRRATFVTGWRELTLKK